jgi:chromate reductase, NAD(P)H dehydrogenase (quinone)
MTKILVFAGSTRTGSYNEKLAALAANTLKMQGAEVTHISLKDYEMPLYNGDYEQKNGPPENAKKLAKLFDAQAGIFIASPEYNAAFTPLLKNTLDWISRVKDGTKPFSKVFALGGASPGSFGGYRSLTLLRQCLEHGLDALVIPEMVSIRAANDAFNDDGALKDDRLTKMLEKCIIALLFRANALVSK